MVKGTLNELSQLRDSGFGQPDPRHGLNLLYWFAHDYIDINNGNIVPKFSPEGTAFGFHKFKNRIEEKDHLLPIHDLPYYEVGNLHAWGAEELPPYVKAGFMHGNPDGNKDRIIVRLDTSGNLERVYVTQHRHQKQFDVSKTYRISKGLLKIIKNIKSREQYLKLLILKPLVEHTIPSSQEKQGNVTQQSHLRKPPENKEDNREDNIEDNSWCTIL